jgi:hypothetical protein
MNNEQIKKQIQQVAKLVADGKTIKVELRGEKKSTDLKIDKKGVRRLSKANLNEENFELKVAKTKSVAAVFSFDFSSNEISDAEITAKIKMAGKLTSANNIVADVAAVPKVTLSRADARAVWILENDCSYAPDKLNPNRTITAPKGFETNLSSIPRIFWSIVDPAELSLAAPLFHDLIYRRAGKLPQDELNPFDNFVFERRQVDDLFLELMTKAGIPQWKRTAAYWAVRGFASFAWRAP